MRLKRLDLIRYGKFTDRTLEFGNKPDGLADFHLIYGPNEAGKSTLFSAFLDLLFGIERLSPYGFLHPYPLMRVGGTLEFGGKTHRLMRVKRTQNTLLDGEEHALSDHYLSAPLGSVDRNSYQNMFSLDDDSIEQGGEAILKSEGELGSMLFAASSGLSNASAILATLKTEADAFYKPQARKFELNDLKAELEALKKQRKLIDVQARDYGALVKSRDDALTAYDQATKARNALRIERDQLRQSRDSLPLLARLTKLQRELDEMEAGPNPPPGWHGLVPDLINRETRLDVQRTNLETQIEDHGRLLEGLELDPAILQVQSALDALIERDIEARYRTALRDMPSRLDEQKRLEQAVAFQLTALGCPDDPEPQALILPTAVSVQIQELAQRHSGLETRLNAAQTEVERARVNVAEARLDLERLGTSSESTADEDTLRKCLNAYRDGDIRSRLSAASSRCTQARLQLNASMTGSRSPLSIDALQHLAVPHVADVAVWKQSDAVCAERLRALTAEINDLETNRAGAASRLEHIHALGDDIDDDSARLTRQQRDKAWAVHRSDLSIESAERFEALLVLDDRLAARRLSLSERLADMRSLMLDIAEADAKLAVMRGHCTDLQVERQDWQARLANLATMLSLPDDATWTQVENFLALRETTLVQAQTLHQVESELAELRAQQAHHIQRLARCLNDETPIADIDPQTLAGRADSVLRACAESRGTRAAAHESLRAAEKTLKSREAETTAAKAALDDWRERWTSTLRSCWLEAMADTLLPVAISKILSDVQELDKTLQAQASLEYRIAGMQRDQAAFQTAIADINAMLQQGVGDDPLTDYTAIGHRLAKARKADAERHRLTMELDNLQAAYAALLREQAVQLAQKQEILEFFACETLGEAAHRLEALAARARVAAKLTEAGDDLCTRLGVSSVSQAKDKLADLSAESLESALMDIDSRLEDLDREVQTLHANHIKAAETLNAIGGSDAVAVLDEQRQTLLLEIQEKTLAHLATRAGILAAEQALRLYREKHRSMMMRRASDAFSRISGGDYYGLSTQTEKNQELLIANAANGASKLARDLSKGTRFQLYLALRISGYHEIATTREPLPFIADDIMETFDDSRSHRAFELMGDMAQVGQVIYLTHHQHLCDIARAACPSVTIHQL